MQMITISNKALQSIRKTYLAHFKNPEGADAVTPFDHFFYTFKENHQISKKELSDLRDEYFCVVETDEDPFKDYLEFI